MTEIYFYSSMATNLEWNITLSKQKNNPTYKNNDSTNILNIITVIH